MPILKSQKATQQGASSKKDDIPMRHPADGAGNSFADRFNKSTGKAQYVPPPPGEYQALITEAKAEREDEGIKECVWFQMVIVNCQEESLNGKQVRLWFNFNDEAGKDLPGVDFFKQAMTMLGATEELQSWEHLEKIMKEITEAQPWVVVKAVQNGKYINLRLTNVMEEQDKKPDLPTPY